MPLPLLHPAKSHFLNLTHSEVEAMVQAWQWPRFRADQLCNWVYAKLADDPGKMSTFTAADRAFLHQHLQIAPSNIAAHQSSSDDTQKLLLTWSDASQAETVMIPDGQRRTACVSSQV